jgi:predicted NodU family carbamoyl transferase
MSLILNVHTGSHDAAAALFDDYEPLAVQLERLTRVKCDGREHPDLAIDEVLSEQRRQRVRLVMIIEIDPRIAAEAAGAPEFGDFENVVDARRLIAQKFRRHVAPRVFLDVL